MSTLNKIMKGGLRPIDSKAGRGIRGKADGHVWGEIQPVKHAVIERDRGLSDYEVNQIRRQRKAGIKRLAKKYGVSKNRIREALGTRACR